jgi:acyl dehydratase
MRLEDTTLLDQVGREVVYVAPDPLGTAAFRYFASAIGDHNPRYLDDEVARSLGYDGCVAPPTLVCETNQYTARAPDESGYVGHSWPGIPPEAVWIRGGNDYRLGRAVRPEDRLQVTWKLVEARDILTRNGASMVRITSEADYFSVDGDWLAWNREVMFLADPERADD